MVAKPVRPIGIIALCAGVNVDGDNSNEVEMKRKQDHVLAAIKEAEANGIGIAIETMQDKILAHLSLGSRHKTVRMSKTPQGLCAKKVKCDIRRACREMKNESQNKVST